MDGRSKRQPLPRWWLLPIGIVLASAIAWVCTHAIRDDKTSARSTVARSHAAPEEKRSAVLDEVEAALGRGEAEAALQMLDRHADELAQHDDRIVLRVRALCALDRASEAKAEIDGLRREDPEAAALSRLEDTCVTP